MAGRPCRSRAGVHAVSHHVADQMAGGRSSTIPRLVDRPGGVLVAVNRLPRGAAAFDVVADRFQQGKELRLVVERSDHDVATLMTHRVVPVVTDDEPPDAVVLHIDPGHARSLSRARVQGLPFSSTDHGRSLSFLGHPSHIRWRRTVAHQPSDHTAAHLDRRYRCCDDLRATGRTNGQTWTNRHAYARARRQSLRSCARLWRMGSDPTWEPQEPSYGVAIAGTVRPQGLLPHALGGASLLSASDLRIVINWRPRLDALLDSLGQADRFAGANHTPAVGRTVLRPSD